MANQKKIARLRNRLFDINPYCPDCGVLMIRPETLNGFLKGKIKNYPPNTVTLDHFDSKLSSNRGDGNGHELKNRICCKECNQKRGKREVDQLGIQYLRELTKMKRNEKFWLSIITPNKSLL